MKATHITVVLLAAVGLFSPARSSAAGEVAGALASSSRPPAASRATQCSGLPAQHCRRISREEIWQAVQGALQGGRMPAGIELRSAELGYNPPLTASADAISLRVKGVSYDAALRKLHFVLDAPRDSRVLPFLVTAPLHASGAADSPRDSGANKFSGRLPGRGLPGLSQTAKLDPADALVTAGKTANMQVFSSNMHLTLEVVPLESGALHQSVRVRVAGGSKILQGEVVAPGQLQSRF